MQYSVGKSSLYAYIYPINSYNGWPGTYQTTSYSFYGDYVKYVSPSRTRTLIEFDLTNTINSIIGQAFIWDNNTDYLVQIDMQSSSYFQPNTVTGCRVVEGIINSNDSPNCKALSSSSFLIGKFS